VSGKDEFTRRRMHRRGRRFHFHFRFTRPDFHFKFIKPDLHFHFKFVKPYLLSERCDLLRIKLTPIVILCFHFPGVLHRNEVSLLDSE